MSNVVQIKRGSGKPDGKLAPYELGFDTKDNTLYIGGKKKTNDEDEEIYGDALQIRVEWAKQAEQANCLTQNALEQVANAEIVVQKALWATGATDADYAANANYATNADSATYAVYRAPYYKPDPDTGMEPNCLIAKSDLLDLIYPVGSIYMSVNSASPQALFGGTWEQIEDRFLLAAGSTYTAGATGGEATHKHEYGFVAGDYYRAPTFFNISDSSQKTGALDANGNPVGWVQRKDEDDKDIDVSVETNNNVGAGYTARNQNTYESKGTTSEQSNLPPYLAVYMWKRTA